MVTSLVSYQDRVMSKDMTFKGQMNQTSSV